MSGTSTRAGVSPTVLWLGAAVGLWAVLVAVAIVMRPLLAIDETRYVSVAWEMWRSGDFLVPRLNGQAYSHKPPLLFWIITAGWAVFGVSEWWARLVAPLFGLGGLLLAAQLARLLWPGRVEIARMVPLVLLATPPWTLFTTLTMFDGLVAFWTLVGLVGMVLAWRGRPRVGWAMFGLGLGLGILAKGPVVVVFLLPAALAAPWWARGRDDGPQRSGGWTGWYLGAALGSGLGVALALAWALPAAANGGERYAAAILWGQTAGRVVGSFAHERAAWWFLAVLPAVLLPWTLWPPLWRGLARMRTGADAGIRLCAVWFLAALAVMSLVSGKQIHYLLPIMPAFALVLVRAAATVAGGGDRRDGIAPGAIVVALGVVLGLAPWLAGEDSPSEALAALPLWIAEVSSLMGATLIAAGLVLALARPATVGARLALMAAQPVLLVVLVHLAVMPAAGPYYDLAEAAGVVRRIQDGGRRVAYVGGYHGQFQFLGRLDTPIDAVEPREVGDWLAGNPGGAVVALYRGRVPRDGEGALYVRPFRGRIMAIWSYAAAAADPGMFR